MINDKPYNKCPSLIEPIVRYFLADFYFLFNGTVKKIFNDGFFRQQFKTLSYVYTVKFK